ncbi:MAG: hypothetical protein RI911_175 [Candidatus Parcubacteria bacterium]
MSNNFKTMLVFLGLIGFFVLEISIKNTPYNLFPISIISWGIPVLATIIFLYARKHFLEAFDASIENAEYWLQIQYFCFFAIAIFVTTHMIDFFMIVTEVLLPSMPTPGSKSPEKYAGEMRAYLLPFFVTLVLFISAVIILLYRTIRDSQFRLGKKKLEIDTHFPQSVVKSMRQKSKLLLSVFDNPLNPILVAEHTEESACTIVRKRHFNLCSNRKTCK